MNPVVYRYRKFRCLKRISDREIGLCQDGILPRLDLARAEIGRCKESLRSRSNPDSLQKYVGPPRQCGCGALRYRLTSREAALPVFRRDVDQFGTWQDSSPPHPPDNLPPRSAKAELGAAFSTEISTGDLININSLIEINMLPVYARDLKSLGREAVRVRSPPSAPNARRNDRIRAAFAVHRGRAGQTLTSSPS